MRTLISVQVLRAIAALAVVLCHFDQVRLMIDHRPDDPIPLYALSSGVDLFFVISGFVMVYSSDQLFGAKGGSGTFLIRRIARIVPPYWLATLVAIPLMWTPHDLGSLLGSFLFIPFRTDAGSIYPIYGVGWTLNCEMYFYVLFAAVLFLRKSIAMPLLCALLAVIALLGYLLEPTSAALSFWSDPIILEFAFGIILALLYQRGLRLPLVVRVGMIVAGLVAISMFAPVARPTGLRFLQWGIPAAMIFSGLVIGEEIDFGWLCRPIKLLGDSSYELYLIHSLVGRLALGAVLFLRHRDVNLPVIPVLVAGVIASILIAIIAEFGRRRSIPFANRLRNRATVQE